jgi:hypothetical protein
VNNRPWGFERDRYADPGCRMPGVTHTICRASQRANAWIGGSASYASTLDAIRTPGRLRGR